MTQVQDAALETQSTGSLLEQIIRETNLDPQDEGYEAARLGVSAFIEEMLKPSFAGEQVKKITVDRMIAELDRRLSAQTDEILHNIQFQELESSWRGLRLLVDRTDFRENISVEMLHVSKDELLDDFLDASEISQSSLYKLAYTAEYGQFGGKPLGAIIGNYYFNPTAMDMRLLQSLASVSAMAHAPFIASAGPSFFGLNSFERLPALKDLQDIFSGAPICQMAGIPGIRGFPLCRPDRAPLPAAPALRSRGKSGQSLCLQGERGRPTRELPLGQRRLRLCLANHGQFCQIPLGRQYHRAALGWGRGRSSRASLRKPG